MEFSDLYKQTNSNSVSFSPDGKYLAVAVDHRLIIRNTDSPKTIHRVFSCTYDTLPYIEELGWSSDSQFILSASYAMNRVDVWCLADETWRCSIVDEVSCIEKAMWAGRHILTFSELDLRLSIWSIENADDRRFIQFPKSRVPPVFHPDGDYMAVAQRHDYHDYIGIYNTSSWSMVKEIAVDTIDLAGLKWSPDGLHLVAWDLAGNFSAVIVNVGGIVKRVYTEDTLGVKSCEWAPSGQLLALGGYDQKIRILNHLTWRPLSVLVHRQAIPEKADVFNEVEIRQESRSEARIRTRFDLAQSPAEIRVMHTVDVHRADPKMGVSILEFSADGEYLASVCEGMPNAVWIWKVDDMKLLFVAQTLRPIRACKWSPVEMILTFATGTPTVYMWKLGEGLTVNEFVSANVMVSGLAWNPNGDCLAVMTKGLFLVGYLKE
ncbi:hypothetical protein H4S04_004351 [Coemansia sp. S16]|nr:hypothetical protein GGI14_002789 [Coemansia sp. S680]KAJ2043190.1 hypothetical protein GGI08_007490 [Coemansia sp. S2]KAJ2047583.1 hypothetical protein H4S04_004351 [Coemansia sp. S16]